MGFNVHETKLGIANNKLVVACKDFLKNNEIILDYNTIKNDYNEVIEKQLEKLSYSSSYYSSDIDELFIVMKDNFYFDILPLKEHFWDMFIVDAFINNNDRNENNWGVIINKDICKLSLAPIYDNNDITILDENQKEFYYQSLIYKYNIFKKIYFKLKDRT